MKKILAVAVILAVLLFACAAAWAEIPYSVSYHVPTSYIVDKDDVDGGIERSVIDTKSGLPQNGNATETKLWLVDAGNGNYKVATFVDNDAEIFNTATFSYPTEPGLSYVNEVTAARPVGDRYTLTRVTAESNIQKFDSQGKAFGVADIFLTNNQDAPRNSNLIIIAEDGSTHIQLYYEPRLSTLEIEADFYDYDISDGSHLTTGGSMQTKQNGINDESGWENNSGAKFAFGNANTGNGLSQESWNGQKLNVYNRNNGAGKGNGVTFGILKGIKDDPAAKGKKIPVFSDGISYKDYFGASAVNGKTAVNGLKLGFEYSGDTYTLSWVGTENGKKKYAQNLSTFRNTTGKIYSNDFWPLDHEDTHKGKDILFGDGTSSLPNSDDGKLHNSYFGMRFALDFELDPDYVGPLDYLFFGDDDMWVFLEDPNGKVTQVIDIGGVHSSVGQRADLWQYITRSNGKVLSGKYKLYFFYTERGASGSTCYMQFTLPSVSVSKTAEYRDLILEKEVPSTNQIEKNKEFSFDVLVDDAIRVDGDKIAYMIHDTDGSIVKTSDSDPTLVVGTKKNFKLKDGQFIHFKMLSIGSEFDISEIVNTGEYAVSTRIEPGSITDTHAAANRVVGEIGKTEQQAIKVIFENKREKAPLELKKTAAGARNEQFEFSVKLYNDEKNPVFDQREEIGYRILDAQDQQTGSGKLTAGVAATVMLKHNERLLIDGVYVGAKYEIKETDNHPYFNPPSGLDVNGTITEAGKTVTVSYVNTKRSLIEFDLKKQDGLSHTEVDGASFELSHAADCGCKYQDSKNKVQTISAVSAKGIAKFSSVLPGHTYTLKETKVPQGYDASSAYSGRVVISQDGNTVTVDGAPVASAQIYNMPLFWPTQIVLSAAKRVDGAYASENPDSYEFMLYGADSQGNVVGDALETVTLKDGIATFGAICYDSPQTVEYYVIREKQGDSAFIDYDSEREYFVTVKVERGALTNEKPESSPVSDQEAGIYAESGAFELITELTWKTRENSGEWTAYDASQPVFENVDYLRTGFEFTKTSSFNGRKIKGAEFTLSHDADCACGYDSEAIPDIAVESDENGLVTFGKELKTEILAGQDGHIYQLRETKAPAGFELMSGVTYTVTVSAEGEVSIKRNENVAEDLMETSGVFENRAEYLPVKARIEARKLYDDRADFKDCESFVFALFDQEITANTFGYLHTPTTMDIVRNTPGFVETVTNNDKGVIRFSEIKFDKAGTYEYWILEVPGVRDNVVYDRTVYKVSVTVDEMVGEDGSGVPVVEFAYEASESGVRTDGVYTDEKPTFLNYEIPETGDNSRLILWMALLAGALGAMGFLMRRRTH